MFSEAYFIVLFPLSLAVGCCAHRCARWIGYVEVVRVSLLILIVLNVMAATDDAIEQVMHRDRLRTMSAYADCMHETAMRPRDREHCTFGKLWRHGTFRRQIHDELVETEWLGGMVHFRPFPLGYFAVSMAVFGVACLISPVGAL